MSSRSRPLGDGVLPVRRGREQVVPGKDPPDPDAPPVLGDEELFYVDKPLYTPTVILREPVLSKVPYPFLPSSVMRLVPLV